MGNGMSKGRNGVFIELDQCSFYPGQTITGKVHVSIHEPQSRIRNVHLRLQGYERTEWIESHQRTEWVDKRNSNTGMTEREAVHKKEYHFHHGNHEFFNETIPLGGAGMSFGMGQYSIPFSVVLPQGIPGSCVIGENPKFHSLSREEERVFCECRYRAKAFVETVGSDNFFGLPSGKTLSDSQDFQVLNVPTPARDIQQSDNVRVNVCCCFNKGEVALDMRTEQDSYKAGDAVTVVANFDNKATVDLTSLNLRLVRHVTLKSEGWHTKYMTDTICSESYPGCSAGRKTQEMLRMVVPSGQRGTYGHADKMLVPSCRGGLIDVRYEIVVDGSVTCANSPRLTLPVVVFEPPRYYQKPQLEFAWQPQLLAPVQLSLSSVVNMGSCNAQLNTVPVGFNYTVNPALQHAVVAGPMPVAVAPAVAAPAVQMPVQYGATQPQQAYAQPQQQAYAQQHQAPTAMPVQQGYPQQGQPMPSAPTAMPFAQQQPAYGQPQPQQPMAYTQQPMDPKMGMQQRPAYNKYGA